MTFKKFKFDIDSKKIMDESSKENYSPSIEILNDDCLICIFKLLPVADRIKFERVSKRWREIGQESWRDLKVLDINQKFLGLKIFGKRHQYPEITAQVVEGILKRCGRYVVKINLKYLEFDCVGLVAEYCRNIQSIVCEQVEIKSLKKLSYNCNNINELHMFTVTNDYFETNLRDAMSKLFSNNKKFRFYKIDYCCDDGECLLQLPLHEMEEIKLGGRPTYLINLVKVIDELKNLRHFESKNLDECVLKSLAFNCSYLSVLKLGYCDRINKLDELLAPVFYKNKQLKILGLGNSVTLTGQCFLSLDKNTVEEIILIQVHNLERDYLINSFPNFVNLHTLEFDCLLGGNGAHIAECVNLCGNLKKLTLDSMKCYTAENFWDSLHGLKELEMLSVNYAKKGTLTTSFLDYISCNLPKLKYLDISGPGYVTDSHLQYLSNLTKLEVLKIQSCIYITGSEIGCFPNLKELCCRNCFDLEDDCLIRLLRCASKLELLDIVGCKKVTNSVLNVAIEETKKRTNKIVLKIMHEHDHINFDEIVDTSPLLHLVIS